MVDEQSPNRCRRDAARRLPARRSADRRSESGTASVRPARTRRRSDRGRFATASAAPAALARSTVQTEELSNSRRLCSSAAALALIDSSCRNRVKATLRPSGENRGRSTSVPGARQARLNRLPSLAMTADPAQRPFDWRADGDLDCRPATTPGRRTERKTGAQQPIASRLRSPDNPTVAASEPGRLERHLHEGQPRARGRRRCERDCDDCPRKQEGHPDPAPAAIQALPSPWSRMRGQLDDPIRSPRHRPRRCESPVHAAILLEDRFRESRAAARTPCYCDPARLQATPSWMSGSPAILARVRSTVATSDRDAS